MWVVRAVLRQHHHQGSKGASAGFLGLGRPPQRAAGPTWIWEADASVQLPCLSCSLSTEGGLTQVAIGFPCCSMWPLEKGAAYAAGRSVHTYGAHGHSKQFSRWISALSLSPHHPLSQGSEEEERRLGCSTPPVRKF